VDHVTTHCYPNAKFWWRPRQSSYLKSTTTAPELLPARTTTTKHKKIPRRLLIRLPHLNSYRHLRPVATGLAPQIIKRLKHQKAVQDVFLSLQENFALGWIVHCCCCEYTAEACTAKEWCKPPDQECGEKDA
jgi:hypothetical protein